MVYEVQGHFIGRSQPSGIRTNKIIWESFHQSSPQQLPNLYLVDVLGLVCLFAEPASVQNQVIDYTGSSKYECRHIIWRIYRGGGYRALATLPPIDPAAAILFCSLTVF